MKKIFIFTIIFIFCCKKDDYNKSLQLDKDLLEIENFLKTKRLNGNNIEDLGNNTDTLYNKVKTITKGLYYIMLQEANGINVSNKDIVYINYKGFRIDNSKEFDTKQNYEIGLTNGAIEGLRSFIPLMKLKGDNGETGMGYVFISSTKAFGNFGNKEINIENNTNVFYQIELISVKN